jgi:uncharacterized protein YegL
MERNLRLEQMQRELKELDGHNLDAVDIIRLHLARNPGDTEKAMELLAEHRKQLLRHQDLYNERTTTLFKMMVDKGLIQAADVEPLLERTLGQIGIVPPPGPIEVAAEVPPTWSEPSVLQAPAAAQEPVEDAEVIEDPEHPRWTPGAGIRPVYLVVDESEDAAGQLDALDAGVFAILGTLKAAPDIAGVLRVAVLGYSDRLTIRLPLAKVDDATMVPQLHAGGPADYAAMFTALASRIDEDLETLEQEMTEIRQPIVFLLSAGHGGDDWREPLRRLVDIHLHQHPPAIVAVGIGETPPEAIAEIATEPRYGFVPAPGTDPTEAIVQYWQSVKQDVIVLGREVLDGREDASIPAPEGFRLASEAVA